MRHLLAPLALGLAFIGTGHAQSNEQEALLFMADMQGYSEARPMPTSTP